MNILQIINFRKAYKKTVAVKNLTLEVQQGAFLGFVGPNGAGKSTTVNYIAGLIRKDQGDLYVMGDLITASSYMYKSRVGFILDKPVYIEKLTGEEYLQFVGCMHNMECDLVQRRAAELLDFLELTDEKDKLINTYSTGMKKKISLAAALIHDPEILILDEPLEGIDPVSATAIKDNLKRMAEKGKTIILTSHNLQVVETLCTDIAIINKGDLLYQGTMKSLYEKFAAQGEADEKMSFEKIFMHFVAQGKQEKRLSWI